MTLVYVIICFETKVSYNYKSNIYIYIYIYQFHNDIQSIWNITYLIAGN